MGSGFHELGARGYSARGTSESGEGLCALTLNLESKERNCFPIVLRASACPGVHIGASSRLCVPGIPIHGAQVQPEPWSVNVGSVWYALWKELASAPPSPGSSRGAQMCSCQRPADRHRIQRTPGVPAGVESPVGS